jgi:hypothetical protein
VIGRGTRDVDAVVDRFVASYVQLVDNRAAQFARGEIPDIRHPWALKLVLAAWVTSPIA